MAEETSVRVALPPDLLAEIDDAVADGRFESRSQALRYAAELVAREQHRSDRDGRVRERALSDVRQRLERKGE